MLCGEEGVKGLFVGASLLANEVTRWLRCYAYLRTLSPALSLKGEGACPCRERVRFQPVAFGVTG